MGAYLAVKYFLVAVFVLRKADGFKIRNNLGLRRSKTQLKVVEHLADCVNNPKIAEAYGGLQSEFCFQPNGINAQDIGALFGQIAFMGFVISTYFLFKRNGLAEIIGENKARAEPNPFECDDSWASVASEGTRGARWEGQRRGLRRRSMQCPQCGGRGVVSMDTSGSTVETCDLCDGTGAVPFTRKVSMPRLPPVDSSERY